jgi:hypothetical protein
MKEFPALKQWQNRPPLGGWAVDIEISGHPFQLRGGPRSILSQYLAIHRKNGIEVSDDEAKRVLNEIWCAREPARCGVMPSVGYMARGLVKSVVSEVRAIASGIPRVESSIVQHRLAICEGCEYYHGGRCAKECGCVMPIKNRFRTAKCPIGKW